MKCDFTKRELQIIANILYVDSVKEWYLPNYFAKEQKRIVKKANKYRKHRILRGRDD